MKKIYSSHYVKLYKENFVYKKKKFNNFHRVIFNNAAMVILEYKNKILITEQYRRGLKKVTFGFPGGHIKKNEKPINSAKRELLEETGLRGESWKFLFSYINSGTYNCGYEYIYKAKLANKVSDIKLSNELESCHWISKKKLIKKIKAERFLPSGIIAASLYYIALNN